MTGTRHGAPLLTPTRFRNAYGVIRVSNTMLLNKRNYKNKAFVSKKRPTAPPSAFMRSLPIEAEVPRQPAPVPAYPVEYLVSVRRSSHFKRAITADPDLDLGTLDEPQRLHDHHRNAPAWAQAGCISHPDGDGVLCPRLIDCPDTGNCAVCPASGCNLEGLGWYVPEYGGGSGSGSGGGSGGDAADGSDDQDTDGTAPDPDQVSCGNQGGSWNGNWCAFEGEVVGDCFVDWHSDPYEDPEAWGRGPGEMVYSQTARDECRWYGGKWAPYE